jgi:hypothetical protein
MAKLYEACGHYSQRSYYVGLSSDLFYQAAKEMLFSPSSLMNLLFQSAGVKRHLYYIARAFGFTDGQYTWPRRQSETLHQIDSDG